MWLQTLFPPVMPNSRARRFFLATSRVTNSNRYIEWDKIRREYPQLYLSPPIPWKSASTLPLPATCSFMAHHQLTDRRTRQGSKKRWISHSKRHSSSNTRPPGVRKRWNAEFSRSRKLTDPPFIQTLTRLNADGDELDIFLRDGYTFGSPSSDPVYEVITDFCTPTHSFVSMGPAETREFRPSKIWLDFRSLQASPGGKKIPRCLSKWADASQIPGDLQQVFSSSFQAFAFGC